MSVIATALKHMMAAGMRAEDIVAAVEEMERSLSRDPVAEKRRAYDRERKAVLRDGGYFEARSSVFTSHDLVCAYCGTEVGPFHCDHVIPLSRGGGSSIENLAIACSRCNLSKKDKFLWEWLR